MAFSLILLATLFSTCDKRDKLSHFLNNEKHIKNIQKKWCHILLILKNSIKADK